MAFQQTEGRGSLFKNDYKTAEKHPDYKGTILIGGKLYDIAMWDTTTQSGKPYFSLRAEEHVEGKYAPKEQAAPAQPQTPPATALTGAKRVTQTAAPKEPAEDYDYFAAEDPNDPDLPF